MANHKHDDHDAGHGHSHSRIDPSIAKSDRGIWAVKWSFVILMITALIQLAIVFLSNSIGLLADTIHNIGDAATAVPLGIAFLFSKRKPTNRFTYGYGRFEDFAGIIVVLLILASAVVAAYESVQRLIHPEPVTHLGAIIVASIIGFAGNEAVAVFRIKVGKEIGSAALIADGYHARTDGWTSLAVLFGAVGVYFGFPIADPVIGLLITVAILFIVYESGKDVMVRALDGVEPEVLDEIRHAAAHVPGVKEVTEIRARWLGHELLSEVNLAVDDQMTVSEAHAVSTQVHEQLVKHLNFMSRAIVHVDAMGVSGEKHHSHELRGDDRHDDHAHGGEHSDHGGHDDHDHDDHGHKH